MPESFSQKVTQPTPPVASNPETSEVQTFVEEIESTLVVQETATTNSVAKESFESREIIAPTMLSTATKPESIAQAPVPLVPTVEATTTRASVVLEEKLKSYKPPAKKAFENSPPEIPIRAEVVTKEVAVVGEQSQAPAHETELSPADVEAEVDIEEYIPADELQKVPEVEAEFNVLNDDLLINLREASDFAEEMPIYETWQMPEDWPQQQIRGEYFVPPVEEFQSFQTPEHVAVKPEVIHELSLPVEEAEQAIIELSQRIQGMDQEGVEKAHQILDEIILKAEAVRSVVELDAESQENELEAEVVELGIDDQGLNLEMEETQDEINELFTRLFDHAEIEYTPALLELCARLVLRNTTAELILENGQIKEELVSEDRGTHEVISQILVALNNIKKVAAHAYYIGKSAVRLYTQQLVVTKAI